MNSDKTITLEQTASAIGRPGSQRATLKGLGSTGSGASRASPTRPPIAA